MKFAHNTLATLGVAGLMLAGLFAAAPAQAVGTVAGTAIDNVATVNYTVGTVPQDVIESSPTGNSTPGVGNGTDTSFVVDNRVDLTLTEVNGAPTPVNPGEPNVVTVFTLTNTGNFTQGYSLAAANLANGVTVHGNADDQQVNNIRAFADLDASGTLTAGDTQFVDSLAPDTAVQIIVVVDVPIGAANGEFANVELTATVAEAGTSGATPLTPTVGGDTAAVDILFGDAGNDGAETAQDGYAIASAALTVAKTEALISDPINGTTDPLHIPGAIVEYTITVTNTGTVDATAVGVSDIIAATLAIVDDAYNGTDEIEYTLAGTTTTCTADGGDADGDNCGLTGATLEANLGVTLGTNAGVDNVLVVRFQATIQ